MSCIPAIARLHGAAALCCWQVTPAARGTAAAAAGRRSQLDTAIVSFLVPPADWGMGDQTLMLVGLAWASPDDATPGAPAGERLAALKRRYDPENVFRLNPQHRALTRAASPPGRHR